MYKSSVTLCDPEREPAPFPPTACYHCLQALVWVSSNAGVKQEAQLAVGGGLPAQVQAAAVGCLVEHLVRTHTSWAFTG